MIDIVLKSSQEGPFIQVPVAQLLFDGYEDPLIARICDHSQAIKELCKAFKIPDRIGLFYGVGQPYGGDFKQRNINLNQLAAKQHG